MMSPEEYELHAERVLWLSEHPLIEREADEDLEEWESERSRQVTLQEVAK